jgi:hypothetical protein
VVKIARDGDGHLRVSRDYPFREEFDVIAPLPDFARVLDLGVAVFDPPGFRRAQDDSIAGLEELGLLVEIGVLRAIDIRLKLYVEGPQPPVVRQPEREIAPALLGFPDSEPAARRLAEAAQKRREPVVPVVVAWNGEEFGSLLVQFPGTRTVIGIVASRRVILRRCDGIDLISAENENVGARQKGAVLARCRRMRRAGRPRHNVVVANQGGDGVGRIPAIAQVGDVVDPDCVALRVVVVDHRRDARPWVERRHDLATIAEPAHDGGRQGFECRPRQFADVKPADLRLPRDCDTLETALTSRSFTTSHPIGLLT